MDFTPEFKKSKEGKDLILNKRQNYSETNSENKSQLEPDKKNFQLSYNCERKKN